MGIFKKKKAASPPQEPPQKQGPPAGSQQDPSPAPVTDHTPPGEVKHTFPSSVSPVLAGNQKSPQKTPAPVSGMFLPSGKKKKNGAMLGEIPQKTLLGQ